MLNYDTVVIGGGLAGYCAAIRSQECGLKTLLITQGESSLQFASGSIDLLGYDAENHESISDPFSAIGAFSPDNPHPYRKIGVSQIQMALNWFKNLMETEGIHFQQAKHNLNHQRITSFGTLKNTWFSQQHSMMIEKNIPLNFDRILVLDIENFHDFQAEITIENLQKNRTFSSYPIKKIPINFPEQILPLQDPTKFINHGVKRSMDFARALKNRTCFDDIVQQIKNQINYNDLLILPAVFSEDHHIEILSRLQRELQCQFHEVPTFPPSLMGSRIASALKSAFNKKGGTVLKSDPVLHVKWHSVSDLNLPHDSSTQFNKKIAGVLTQNIQDSPIQANNYILASGRFFNRGLTAHRSKISETIFDLDIEQKSARSEWAKAQFFDSHPLMKAGVHTNDDFHPYQAQQLVSNLYCIGGVLGGFDAVKEGAAGGISISTGFYCSQLIANANKSMASQNIQS